MKTALPGFRALDAALRRTTEHLALELDQPAAAAPDWSELEWDVARGVAAMQGISVLLAHRLRWTGPPRWQEYLRDQVNHGLRRDARIGALITQLDVLLQRERIGALGLKGTALRGLDIYDPGERPMGDVDLLASPDDRDAIGRVLAALGYREIYRTQRHAVFRDRAPDAARGFGEHVDNPLKVELHECVAEPLPASVVDITARLMPLESRSGLRPYRSRAALMAHLLLHAAGNMRAHALRLIQLVDLGRLSHHMTRHDWEELLDGSAAGAPSWWAYPPLLLAQRYCSACVPPVIQARLAAVCPWSLQRAARGYTLSEVSWSNLRIPAFPGIEWSRSPAEGLRFAKSRLLPSRAALDGLAAAQIEQPQLATIGWYGRSHLSRILRWAFRRPPRVQTLCCMRAALEE